MAGGGSLALLGAAMVVTALGGCGAGEPGASSSDQRTPVSSTIAPAPDPAALWTAYLQGLGGEVWLSTKEPPDDAVGLVALVDRDGRSVLVAAFDGTRWATVAEIALPPPEFEFGPSREIEVADVTGDGRDDFLVPMEAAQTIGVVVSDDGGSWRALPAQDRAGAHTSPYVGINPRFEDGALVSDERSCDPTCAEGETYSVVWSYSDGVLLRSG